MSPQKSSYSQTLVMIFKINIMIIIIMIILIKMIIIVIILIMTVIAGICATSTAGQTAPAQR